MLNCKQGDLAIVVRSKSGKNIGKIVRCIRLLSRMEIAGMKTTDGRPANLYEGHDWWQVNQPMPVFGSRSGEYYGNVYCYPDANLKPLRPDDGEDETLTWARKPNNVKEYCK